MNTTPTDYQSVPYEKLYAFVHAACVSVGLPTDRAGLLAELLSTNDARGNFSHGTRQIATYARLMRDGKLNNSPEVRTERESPVHLLVDGDGGLGYFPMFDGTKVLTEKAKDSGIAVLATRNHGHFGAAGIYARMTADDELLTFVTSGHQLNLQEGMPLYSAAGGSPMAFSAPTGDGAPIVVDFGCMHDLYANDPHRDEVAELTPGIVLRSIGMGEICQTWGGFLTGLDLDDNNQNKRWAGANQGALAISFRIDLFSDPGVFTDKVKRYSKRIRTLEPIPPFEESFPAGVVETHREHEHRISGIPVSPEHKDILNSLADELGIEGI